MMDGHSRHPHSKYWMSVQCDTIEDGRKKKSSFPNSQVRKPIKVEREPYTGPVWTPDGVKPGENKVPPSPTKSSGQPANRQTKGGHRDLHASGFDLSGEILLMSEMCIRGQGPYGVKQGETD